MGLFARHDDDVVSPFDVDDAPAYISPDAAIEREARAEAEAERRRQAARTAADAAERRRRNQPRTARRRTPSRARDAAQARRAAATSPAGQTYATGLPSPAGPTYADDPFHSNGAPRAAGPSPRPAGTPNRNAAPRTRTPSASGWVVAAFVLLGVTLAALSAPLAGFVTAVAAIVLAIGALTRAARDPRHRGRAAAVVALVLGIALLAADAVAVVAGLSSTSPPDSSWSRTYGGAGAADPEPRTYERTGAIAYDHDGTELQVSIDRACAGTPDDLTGGRTVVIEITVRNTGSTTTGLESESTLEVFQNGIGLTRTYLSGDAESFGYDDDSGFAEIRPGASHTVTEAFVLRDGDTPLLARLASYDGMSTVTAAFSVGGSTPGEEFEGLATADVPDVVPPDEAAVAGMTDIVDHRGTTVAQLAIDGVVRGPDTSDGTPTAIVTYRWVNRSDEPMTLWDCGMASAWRDGVELEVAFPAAAMEGYDPLSQSTSILPGAMFSATIAYAVPDYDGRLDVRLTDYDDTVLAERTFELSDQTDADRVG